MINADFINQVFQCENAWFTIFFKNGTNKTGLINTGIIYIRDFNGIKRLLTAILDSTSESSFLTLTGIDFLGLKK